MKGRAPKERLDASAFQSAFRIPPCLGGSVRGRLLRRLDSPAQIAPTPRFLTGGTGPEGKGWTGTGPHVLGIYVAPDCISGFKGD
jgi:hypothetical protein